MCMKGKGKGRKGMERKVSSKLQEDNLELSMGCHHRRQLHRRTWGLLVMWR